MPNDPILIARPRLGKLARLIVNLVQMAKKAERS